MYRSIQCCTALGRFGRGKVRPWLLGRNACCHLSSSSCSELQDYAEQQRSDQVERLLEEYCEKSPTSSSLQTLMKTGRGELLGKQYKPELMGRMGQRLATHRILAQFASYLRHEIPIRLAHRIRDLDTVPVLRDLPSIRQVKDIYIESFLDILEASPILNEADEEEFAHRLEALYTKHAGVMVMVAKGAFELRKSIMQDNGNSESEDSMLDTLHRMEECHQFLDRFYMTRIGIRVLAGHYLALRGRLVHNYVGMINLQTSPSDIVAKASRDVMGLCREKYGRTPRVVIKGRTDLTFPYMPSYLQYILLELLKNALRATAEHHADAAELPPVTVIVADGTENEDVVIKIADEGGGIARSRIEMIWSYLYTTAEPALQEAIFSGKDSKNLSHIAGLGYGLPISRSYCRYFGGDIDLMSMDGHGTDVFVYLKRLGDSKEPIPL